MTGKAEAVETVFEHYLGEADDYQLEKIMVVEHDETIEEFLEVVISVSEDGFEENKPHECIRPVFPAYAHLVDEAGLEYPLEAVLCVRDILGEGTLFGPILSFRISTMWVREHVHGNYTLPETVDRVFGTIKAPEAETLEGIEGWVPEYSRDWRQEEPMFEGEEYPEKISYDDWTGSLTDFEVK